MGAIAMGRVRIARSDVSSSRVGAMPLCCDAERRASEPLHVTSMAAEHEHPRPMLHFHASKDSHCDCGALFKHGLAMEQR
jgi:hypothetical protein